MLRPGGMYVMNLIDYPPLGFVRAEAATAGQLFEHVAVISGSTTLAGRRRERRARGERRSRWTWPRSRPTSSGWGETASTGILAGPAAVATFIGDATILSDDYAPVDQLLGR